MKNLCRVQGMEVMSVSGVHKNPTISFRISDYERREIEARIKASGMMKKTFLQDAVSMVESVL
mgnify:CR=1 FL=1